MLHSYEGNTHFSKEKLQVTKVIRRTVVNNFGYRLRTLNRKVI